MLRQIIPILALLGGMIFLMLGGGLHGVIIPVRGQIEGFTAHFSWQDLDEDEPSAKPMALWYRKLGSNTN